MPWTPVPHCFLSSCFLWCPPAIAKRYQRVAIVGGLALSSVDDNNRFTIHLGSIYANAQDACLKNCCPPIFGPGDLCAVQISYAIAGFPNLTSLVSCFPPEWPTVGTSEVCARNSTSNTAIDTTLINASTMLVLRDLAKVLFRIVPWLVSGP